MLICLDSAIFHDLLSGNPSLNINFNTLIIDAFSKFVLSRKLFQKFVLFGKVLYESQTLNFLTFL